MNLYFRLLITLLWGSMRKRDLDLLEDSLLTFRVLPTDLDPFGHMNNGRFLSMMDLGRMDLLLRQGLLRIAMRRKWRPIITSVAIRYRRPLKPFRSYKLRTRLLCWGDSWGIIEQRFECNGVAAIAYVKTRILSSRGVVPVDDVLKARTAPIPAAPPIPPEVADWLRTEERMGTLSRVPAQEPLREPLPSSEAV